jgi:chromosome segregation ATPase|tara:strand:- start:399 stop:689 length:291 start_codon:yes stop_codon:yes gene_type:complete
MTKRLTINDTWNMGMSALKACKEHNETINKMATHAAELWNEISLKNNRITELKNELHESKDDAEYISSCNADLLAEVNELKIKLATYTARIKSLNN